VTRLRCGDRVFEPRLVVKGGATEVVLEGRTFRLSAEPLEPGVFRVSDDRGERAFLLHVARDGARVHLFCDGVAWTLEEEREGAREAHRHDGSALEAPMPGRVAAVRVSVGQAVKKGEELLVVEAMKMENALRAPRDGVVRALHVAAGDPVVPGRALVELEP
jgi:3-methylcrotonyl-CoA carboxylase alpha subunit